MQSQVQPAQEARLFLQLCAARVQSLQLARCKGIGSMRHRAQQGQLTQGCAEFAPPEEPTVAFTQRRSPEKEDQAYTSVHRYRGANSKEDAPPNCTVLASIPGAVPCLDLQHRSG